MPALVLVSGPHAGRVFPLTYGAVVGRMRGCEIHVGREESISRRHARFGLDENGWYVEDLESTNGVLVNDYRVRRATLREEDHVTIGVLVFRFIFEALN